MANYNQIFDAIMGDSQPDIFAKEIESLMEEDSLTEDESLCLTSCKSLATTGAHSATQSKILGEINKSIVELREINKNKMPFFFIDVTAKSIGLEFAQKMEPPYLCKLSAENCTPADCLVAKYKFQELAKPGAQSAPVTEKKIPVHKKYESILKALFFMVHFDLVLAAAYQKKPDTTDGEYKKYFTKLTKVEAYVKHHLTSK